MEERRLLVAVALSLLILTGYSWLFGPGAQPPTPEAAAPAAETTAPVMPGVAPAAPRANAPETPAEPPTEVELRPVPTIAAEFEQRVEVQGGDYAIAFSNRGARLLSWTLARYLDARGKPEEMVPARTPGMRPLDIETGDADLDERLRNALFRASTTALRVEGSSPRTLRFEYADGQLEAEKTLTFQGSGLVSITASVTSGGQPLPCRLVWGPGLGNPSEAEQEVRGYQAPQGVALVEGGVERFAPDDLEPSGQTLPAVRWVGVESVYFVALMIPPEGGGVAAVRPVAQPGSADDEPTAAAAAEMETRPLEPLQLYVGAKDHQALKKLGHGLEKVVPVGDWIGPIVVPLTRLLRWVHSKVGNWGWAIVILTVMINMLMAPLRHYSIANGMKMAKMQPEMKVIQERYRKVPMMDPRRQKMQEEMGVLYAKHGMSMSTQMLVGCLPLLLTMPFLFAFYRVLMISVELRGAPFLWIPDLSQKDPLFVTPVLMGVSMYVMQKMTPSTMDPSQQRIMMLMPVMLAGMFLWAPAGLNLYWLTANLWSMLQQVVEMRLLQARGRGAGPEEGTEEAMKDRVFTGASVPGALRRGRHALGLPETELRYVVLDPGSEGGRGLQATPARVAVLLDEAPAGLPRPASAPPALPTDARAGIRAIVRAMAETAGIDVWAEIEEDEEAEKVVVHLKGPDHAFFFGREGRGDVLRATEHLLQRIFGAEFMPRPLRVKCEGFQERRDAALGDDARVLAAAVRGDGAPRVTEPLNAYERRVVHVALSDEPDVTTYSVGEGAARRVTVALAEETPAPARDPGDGDG